MLVVLVVLTLLPTWSDGLVLTKCELKSRLEAVLQGEFSEDLIAKLTCAVEHISGFNSSLETITDQIDPRTLIIDPFLFNNDEDHASGMGELALPSSATNTESENYVFPENMGVTNEPLSNPYEDKFVTGQVGKQIAAPFFEVGDASWISGDGSVEGSEENQGSPEPTDVHYDTFEMLFGPTDLPLETTKEPIHYDTFENIYGDQDSQLNRALDPTGIPLDTYEMLFGPKDLPPETPKEPIYYDTYEMLFGPTGLPPETTEPSDVPYDSYEMLYGEQHLELNSAPDPTDIPLDTYEMLFGPTDLPPETPKEPIYYDTYEMLFGPTDLPPGTTEPSDVPYDSYEMLYGEEQLELNKAPDSTDIPLDTYEMLFSPTDLPPETSTEPIHYDTYEMLFGPKDNPMDGPLDTTGPPETKSRYKRSSGDPTTLYGIFQLSNIACNSGSSMSLNLCRLDCSALTDDDITDDIACLKTLNFLPLTFTQECKEPANYITECG